MSAKARCGRNIRIHRALVELRQGMTKRHIDALTKFSITARMRPSLQFWNNHVHSQDI
jgi:hypothetical protein